MVRLFIRIDFEGAESIGPGKVRLLELVQEHGSIRRASVAMNMTYAQAWRLLDAAQQTIGAPIIVAVSGGSNGGGARLTELGRIVVRRYREIERQAGLAAAEPLGALRCLAEQSNSEKVANASP